MWARVQNHFFTNNVYTNLQRRVVSRGVTRVRVTLKYFQSSTSRNSGSDEYYNMLLWKSINKSFCLYLSCCQWRTPTSALNWSRSSIKKTYVFSLILGVKILVPLADFWLFLVNRSSNEKRKIISSFSFFPFPSPWRDLENFGWVHQVLALLAPNGSFYFDTKYIFRPEVKSDKKKK